MIGNTYNNKLVGNSTITNIGFGCFAWKYLLGILYFFYFEYKGTLLICFLYFLDSIWTTEADRAYLSVKNVLNFYFWLQLHPKMDLWHCTILVHWMYLRLTSLRCLMVSAKPYWKDQFSSIVSNLTKWKQLSCFLHLTYWKHWPLYVNVSLSSNWGDNHKFQAWKLQCLFGCIAWLSNLSGCRNWITVLCSR